MNRSRSWRTRSAVGVVLLLVVLGVTVVINGNVVLTAWLHVPVVFAYMVLFRSAPSSALGAVGLAVGTAWTSFVAVTAEYADERAFYPLTSAVVWALVLMVAGVVGSSIAGPARNP